MHGRGAIAVSPVAGRTPRARVEGDGATRSAAATVDAPLQSPSTVI
jgi:hypothetical protein